MKKNLEYFTRFHHEVVLKATLTKITNHHVKTMAEINYLDKNWYCVMGYCMSGISVEYNLSVLAEDYLKVNNITELSVEMEQQLCNQMLRSRSYIDLNENQFYGATIM